MGGAPLQDLDPPVEVDEREPNQAGQFIARADDLLPQGILDAVNPREALSDDAYLRAKTFGDNIHMSAKVDCCHIDVPAQIGERPVELAEPLVKLRIHGVILLRWKEVR
jgi:hypothetical protein